MPRSAVSSHLPTEPTSPRRPPPPRDGVCALCAQPRPLSFHHLIPRRNHARRWFRLRFTLAEMRSRGLWLCRGCHDALHRHFDEATLGRRLNTREALLAEPLIARHVEWARRQRVARSSA
jgi:5-methylcytosine-specific restriction endonuclease McrA